MTYLNHLRTSLRLLEDAVHQWNTYELLSQHNRSTVSFAGKCNSITYLGINCFSNRIIASSVKTTVMEAQMSCIEHMRENILYDIRLGVFGKSHAREICINEAVVYHHDRIFGQSEGHCIRTALIFRRNPGPNNRIKKQQNQFDAN